MAASAPPDPVQEVPPTRASIGELVVDLFGTLVPGVSFMVALVPAILVPVWALVVFDQDGADRAATVSTLPLLGSYLYVVLLAGFVVVSYMVGYLFFRQDPKVPDRRSYMKVRKNLEYNGPVRAAGDNPSVEFPYLHLYEYLADRGFHHLAAHVPWKGEKSDTHHRRSKHFINSLKSRVAYFSPRSYRSLARNEAHVRLMCSAWYIGRALIRVAVLGFAVGVSAAVATIYLGGGELAPIQLLGLLTPVLALGAAIAVKSQVESALHYQRIREVFSVLQTAHIVGTAYPELWNDLE